MSTIICIDYGTAMSKAAASFDGDAPFPIPLGQCEGDPVKEYAIDSSLLFAADGKVYLGSVAVGKSREGRGPRQPRLDSLKRLLTEGEQVDLDAKALATEVNRTGTEFSAGDALILMFSHILRLTHDFLRKQYGADALDDVTYRFTRPSFDPERAAWIDRQMRSALAAARALERRLEIGYDGSHGARRVRALLDDVRLRSPVLDGISSHGLVEPVAAGLLVLSQVPNRRFLATVIDIGAGTTDIALFAGVQPDGAPLVDRVQTYGVPLSITMAGDRIDSLLSSKFKEAAEAALTDEEQIEMELNIRPWKEDMFRFEETFATFRGGRRVGPVRLHTFLADDEYRKMEAAVIATLLEVIGSAAEVVEEYATLMGPPLWKPVDSIEIIPCGGGAKLPIFEELKGGYWQSLPSKSRLGFEVKRPVPDDVVEYDEYFPQLAVALGGALAFQPRVNGLQP